MYNSRLGNNPFEGRLRVRANGLVFNDNCIALVQIHAPQTGQLFWMPPGGGVEFGETLEDAVIREVREEINVDVHQPKLWYITEYISGKWHAVEFYFACEILSDNLSLGNDPELGAEQMLKDAQWIPLDSLSHYFVKPPFLSERVHLDIKNGRNSPEFIPTKTG